MSGTGIDWLESGTVTAATVGGPSSKAGFASICRRAARTAECPRQFPLLGHIDFFLLQFRAKFFRKGLKPLALLQIDFCFARSVNIPQTHQASSFGRVFNPFAFPLGDELLLPGQGGHRIEIAGLDCLVQPALEFCSWARGNGNEFATIANTSQRRTDGKKERGFIMLELFPARLG